MGYGERLYKHIVSLIGTPTVTDLSTDIKNVQTAVDAVDGYHDVATVDGTSDVVMRDVIGRKTDTANTTVGTQSSLMRYVKGIIGLIAGLATPTNITAGTITTVTNLTNAPTAGDLTATMKTSIGTACTGSLNTYDPPTRAEATTDKDAIVTEVNANETKIDTLTTNVGIIDGYHDVPVADAETDTVIRDVVGRKTDTEVIAVGTTKSIVAYLKGLITQAIAIKAKTDTILTNLYQYKISNTNTNSATFVTMLSVTGSGILYYIAHQNSTVQGELKVTIDGIAPLTITVTNTVQILTQGNTNLAATNWENTIAITATEKIIPMYFQDSLLVEARVTSGAVTIIKVHYGGA